MEALARQWLDSQQILANRWFFAMNLRLFTKISKILRRMPMRLLSVISISASLFAGGLLQEASATTLGMPIFNTAPSTIFITNQFDGTLPTPSYTLSLHSTIATAEGAPELVGQNIDFTWFFDGGFDDGTIFSSLNIGGTEILVDPLLRAYELSVGFPYIELSFDPGTGLADWAYPGIFAGFGPRTGIFPEVTLSWALDAILPTREGYLYCATAGGYCEYSEIAGLTEIAGLPAYVEQSFIFPEGRIDDATVTFSTVDGRQIAPVPLPAGGILFASVLAGLGWRARRSARLRRTHRA
jgi:hypothetical protein